MNNLHTNIPIHINVDTTLSDIFKLKSISYTLYKSLLCPIKYYHSYIYKQKYVNESIIKGIVVHEIYEEILKGIKNKNDIDGFYSKDYVFKKFDKVCKNLNYQITSYDELIIDILNMIHKEFIQFVKTKIDNGYKLYLEQSNLNKNEVTIFNNDIDLYTKADIILTKNDKVEIIDIKTGNIYPYYIEQVVFYLYSYLKHAESKNLNASVFIGSVYSAKLNKYKIFLYSNKDYIIGTFEKYIQKLTDLYIQLGINNIIDLKSFVEIVLINIDDYSKYEIIKKNNDCNFCNLKDICPIFNQNNKQKFINHINSLPLSEKIVIVNKEKKDFLDLNLFNRR